MVTYFKFHEYRTKIISKTCLRPCLEHMYTAPQKHESTLLHTFVLNEFLTADHSYTKKYFWKILIESGSSHLYALFGTVWVQIGQLVEAQWDIKLSVEFEIDVIFLRKQRFYRFHAFFKDSLCLKKLIFCDKKGVKRSVISWKTRFCVQIGQFLETKWDFKIFLKTVKSLFSKENDVDFDFFRKFKISLCFE